MGYKLTGGSVEAWEYSELTRLVTLLENDLRPLFLAGEKMVNNKPMEKMLLPTDIRLNRETNQFEYLDRRENWLPIVKPSLRPTVSIAPK